MEKVFITDKQGNKVLPKTHVSAVYDDEGNDLSSHLGAFEDEVRGLVETPHQEYVTVATYSALPASGSEDTIYRVSSWDGSANSGAGAVDVTVYSEYAWNGSDYVFLCVKSQIDEVFDITVYNSNTKYADLSAALGVNGVNIPESLRRGGMSIKYVQSSDNKYVQWRLMADDWSTKIGDWQGVENAINPFSSSLPTSKVCADNQNKSSSVHNIFLEKITVTTGNTQHYVLYAKVKYYFTNKSENNYSLVFPEWNGGEEPNANVRIHSGETYIYEAIEDKTITIYGNGGDLEICANIDTRTVAVTEIINKFGISLNNVILETNKYINPINGEIVSTEYNIGITPAIEIPNDVNYLYYLNAASVIHNIGYRFEDASHNVISYGYIGIIGEILKAPTNAKYFRISVSRGLYSNFDFGYILNNTPFLNKGVSDIQKAIGGICGTASKNMFNEKWKAYGGLRYYIDPTYGEVVYNTYFALYISHLIPLAPGKTDITISTADGTFSNTTGYRFLDKKGTIISCGSMGTNNSLTLNIPLGAAFFQFSTTREKVQVEWGTTATAYEEYEPLPEKWLDCYLPATIPFIKGVPSAIYKDNIFNTDDYENFTAYFEGNGVTDLFNEAAKISINTSSSIVIKQIHGLEQKQLFSFTANCIDPALIQNKQPKIMVVGDSWTEVGVYAGAMLESLIRDGFTPKMIGAMHTKNNWNVRSENQTGGTLANSFLQQVSGTCYLIDVQSFPEQNIPINYNDYRYITINNKMFVIWGYDLDSNGNGKMRIYNEYPSNSIPSSGMLVYNNNNYSYSNATIANKNPFWNPNTDELDLDFYFNIWGFEVPDILVIQFMWNDLYDWQTDFNTFINQLRAFIGLWKTYNPDIKIVYSTECYAPIGATSYRGRKTTVLNLMKELSYAFANEANFAICPSFAFVDRKYGFGFKNEDTIISSRIPSHKILLPRDDVHPSTDAGGYQQTGDAICAYIEMLLS